MTSETRTFIELRDIAAIEVRCPHCRAKISDQIDEQFDRFGSTCPNCREELFPIEDRTILDVDAVKQFVAKLRSLLNRPRVAKLVLLEVSGVKATAPAPTQAAGEPFKKGG